MQGFRVADQTWATVDAALANDAISILPIAASCKEHGLHLPMSTDYIQAEWLVAHLITKVNAVIWPTVNYGYYPAFVDYPGSSSLNKSTFENVIMEITQGIIKNGANKMFILNTGISTIEPLQNIVTSYLHSSNIRLINIYSGERFCEIEKLVSKQIRGGHADEIETSIMLAINADMVNMRLAESNTNEIQPGPFNRTHKDQPNYSPSGVYGDATLATLEKGQRLTDAILKDVLHALQN